MSSPEPEPTLDLNLRPAIADAATIPPDGSAAELVRLLDQYLADLESGEAPDRQQLLAAHPELAAQLEACLAGIEFVHQAKAHQTASEAPAQLGEFQIVRELGRGGMGVVYEAEQTSLRRRVALKVLRFGVVADSEAMQRFQREAETVAQLHHTNIVPIFAVGSERGVQYYAMQYIAGRSLADVQTDARKSAQPLEIRDVVRWGLQAAEALAHAHQRGVIHRDIKPSNLLIDAEGIVWLTDFGLAKRADEVTLTVSGALMGTPRYMSPEQAEAMRRPIDHRTDLYSLGATLFELATGRPVFDSVTPHVVLSQILTEEPARPRAIRPELSRDLETVLLTCLAKEPAKRYSTAQALADDLRAVLDGRAIQARREPWIERMARTARKNQKAVMVAAATAVVVLIVATIGIAGWRWYTDWRLGRAVLSSSGPPITAELLAESDDTPIREPFTIGTKTALAAPAGEYRLRINAPGRLGRTLRVGLNQGETIERSLSLEEGLLLGSETIPYSFASESVRFGSGTKADIVEWTGQTLIRRDGASGKVIWDLAQPTKPWPAESDPLAMMRKLMTNGDEKRPGHTLSPAPDLNGDGTGDVVWSFIGTPSLLALSGRDGSMLWSYKSAPEKVGRVFGVPAVSDVDGDGVLDLVATFAQFDDANQWQGLMTQGGEAKGRRVVEAVSGRRGERIWTHPLDVDLVSFDGRDVDRAAETLSGRDGPVVGVVVGRSWVTLNRRTGAPVGSSIDLGFSPIRPVQTTDLDGDGFPEVIALGRGTSPLGAKQSELLTAVSTATGTRLWTLTIRGAFGTQAQGKLASEWPLVADLDGDGRVEIAVPDRGPLNPTVGYRGVALLEGATGRVLWSQPLAPYTNAADGVEHLTVAPDLDGDGVRDVIAVSRFHGRHPFTIFADGSRETARVFVDALSGKSGRSLWHWDRDLGEHQGTLVWPIQWWGRGPDRGALLSLPIGGNLPDWGSQVNASLHPEKPETYALSVASGREFHAVPGLGWVRVADLDGDGVDDLWGMVDGKLRGFRGEAPEAWRVLGPWTAAGDLDGDSVTDVVTTDFAPPPEKSYAFEAASASRTLVARSGRDGRLLWRQLLMLESTLEQRAHHSYFIQPFPEGGDFDGDGSPDILVRMRSNRWQTAENLGLELRSGRTGKPLWIAGSLPTQSIKPPDGYELSFKPQSDIREVFVADVDSTGRPDLCLFRAISVAIQPLSGSTGTAKPATNALQYRLTRLSGRDGHVIWDGPVDDVVANAAWREIPRKLGDIDGDGSLDLVVPLYAGTDPGPSAKTRFALYAVSLRTGERLWSSAVNFDFHSGLAFDIGDIDGDRRAEVVLLEPSRDEAKEPVQVRALDGRDGTLRWSWRGGDQYDRINQGRTAGFCLTAFEAKGPKTICVNVGAPATSHGTLILLDERGNERVRKDLGNAVHTLAKGDLDGDGREELLVYAGGKLCALTGDLTEHWAVPGTGSIRQVVPGRNSEPGTVIMNPLEGLDGATGAKRWTALRSPAMLLDRGGKSSAVRFVWAFGANETVCRLALATGPTGKVQSPSVVPERILVHRPDPRWTRPLPWTERGTFHEHPRQLLVVGGLSLICVIAPWGVVRLATRRRVWGMPLLLAIPVVAALPLSVVLMISSAYPDQVKNTGHWIVLLSLVAFSILGLPSLVYPYVLFNNLLRRRWRRVVFLLGLTALSTLAVATYMLQRDRRAMPSLEYFDWSEWYSVVPLGAYATGVLLIIGSTASGVVRRVRPWLTKRRAENDALSLT
jgi:predicted Ser/Thr protein kinase